VLLEKRVKGEGLRGDFVHFSFEIPKNLDNSKYLNAYVVLLLF
jgi:hypothetical protein